MVDLLHRIAEQREHLRDWEVTRQPDGVLVRVKSRERYGTEAAADDAAPGLLAHVVAPGYEPVSAPVTAAARAEDRRGGHAWRACVEVVLAPTTAPPHLKDVSATAAD